MSAPGWHTQITLFGAGFGGVPADRGRRAERRLRALLKLTFLIRDSYAS
jgi:hypothetical protein